MAKTQPDKPDEGAGTQRHNAKAREEAIKTALHGMARLDSEIDRLIEKHISDLREEKRDIKAKLRDDFEISTKVFNARYNLFKIEARGDEKVIDDLRELFEAAPFGAQSNFLEVVDGGKA